MAMAITISISVKPRWRDKSAFERSIDRRPQQEGVRRPKVRNQGLRSRPAAARTTTFCPDRYLFRVGQAQRATS
jgi:hypothetical protein